MTNKNDLVTELDSLIEQKKKIDEQIRSVRTKIEAVGIDKKLLAEMPSVVFRLSSSSYGNYLYLDAEHDLTTKQVYFMARDNPLLDSCEDADGNDYFEIEIENVKIVVTWEGISISGNVRELSVFAFKYKLNVSLDGIKQEIENFKNKINQAEQIIKIFTGKM